MAPAGMGAGLCSDPSKEETGELVLPDAHSFGSANPEQAMRDGILLASASAPPDDVEAVAHHNGRWKQFSKVQTRKLYEQVAEGLARAYKDKLLPLEKDTSFHQFYKPELPPAYFSCKPIILAMGQYSTGKTTFIRHLLEHDYPGMSIGPEPTTDRFIAVCHGNDSQSVPGNALVFDQTLPFTPLSSFGNNFLSRLECAKVPSPILQGVTFVDTPGVLSGEKQRVKRGYDYEEVMSWFAEHAEMILLFFDAHKLDISDEFKRCIAALPNSSRKIRIILNKADQVTSQQLIRVHGALMWSLGKVLDAPEVARVYLGSFWDEPLRNDEQRNLFDKEKADLLTHIEQLPRNSSMNKISDLSKRARLTKAHALVIDHLYSSLPTFYGQEQKKLELIESLPTVYKEVSRLRNVPLGDFPDMDVLKAKLQTHDWSTFKRLDSRKMDNLDALLSKDIPALLTLIPGELAEHEATKAG